MIKVSVLINKTCVWFSLESGCLFLPSHQSESTRKIHWASVCRNFIGALLHRHNSLNHWPYVWMHSSVPRFSTWRSGGWKFWPSNNELDFSDDQLFSCYPGPTMSQLISLMKTLLSLRKFKDVWSSVLGIKTRYLKIIISQ
jgi:hypothetical protein